MSSKKSLIDILSFSTRRLCPELLDPSTQLRVDAEKRRSIEGLAMTKRGAGMASDCGQARLTTRITWPGESEIFPLDGQGNMKALPFEVPALPNPVLCSQMGHPASWFRKIAD